MRPGSLNLTGRIVRSHRGDRDIHEYGIAFDALSVEAEKRFSDYVFAKMYEMVGLPDWPTHSRVDM